METGNDQTVLFNPVNGRIPDTLSEVVGQAVGAASVCWESMEGTGVFNDARARAIVDDVIGWINANYVPKTVAENAVTVTGSWPAICTRCGKSFDSHSTYNESFDMMASHKRSAHRTSAL